MALHTHSEPLTRHIGRTVTEIRKPLEEVEWCLWEPGDEEPDPKATIRADFWVLGLQLANADHDLSDDEIDLIRDVGQLFDDDDDDGQVPSSVFRNRWRKTIRSHPELFERLGVPGTVSLLEIWDRENGTDCATKARTMFFRFADAMIRADGQVTQQGEETLASFKHILYTPASAEAVLDESDTRPAAGEYAGLPGSSEEPESLETLLGELTSLIGLDAVKTDVLQLVNFLKVQQMRRANGMATVPVSRHLVFHGNPGTGKTTVARLLARIYKAMGLVSRGHLVETDRSGLVAGYVGQTALKVKEVVNEALGGVLFIDEAYALAGDDRDYGREAIDTLIKLMEDNRDDLIVVVAGYPDKMSHFLMSNPGLKSRFSKYFHFDDYSPPQLMDILELFCRQSGFRLSGDAWEKLSRLFCLLCEARDETFGNARLARNLFEQTISNQANRIVSLSGIDENLLSTIEAVDVPDELETHSLALT